jgi:PAS domain S-box-containing protein
MRISLMKTWLWFAAESSKIAIPVAVLAAGLFAVYSGVGEALANWDHLLVVAILAGAGAISAFAVAYGSKSHHRYVVVSGDVAYRWKSHPWHRAAVDFERLRESYCDLFHNSPVMFFSLDHHGHFLTFNDTLLRRLGYIRDELLHQPYGRLLAPGEKPLSHALGGEAEVVVTKWLRRDGAPVNVWVWSTPIKDEHGQFDCTRSAALDVSSFLRVSHGGVN